MEMFIPKRAFFEPGALEYPLGQQIKRQLEKMDVPIRLTSSHNRITGITGKSAAEAYREAKRTLVVGVRKTGDFATCKPSAHYQLPICTSCPGMCEYCYLATTLGRKPYVRVYVNVAEILDKAVEYIKERAPEVTVFEGSATSDPVPTEYLTGALRKTIEFFGGQPLGRFRFVTKDTDVDSLLTAAHNGHTRFRFSLNAATVIERYEHRTSSLAERLEAAGKVAEAGYPLGFIIAPLFYFSGWKEHYEELFRMMDKYLSEQSRRNLAIELITHRFTRRAKNNIMAVFPSSTLPMEEENRKFKYGQFGYGKFLYEKDVMADMKDFMLQQVKTFFPQAKVEYFV